MYSDHSPLHFGGSSIGAVIKRIFAHFPLRDQGTSKGGRFRASVRTGDLPTCGVSLVRVLLSDAVLVSVVLESLLGLRDSLLLSLPAFSLRTCSTRCLWRRHGQREASAGGLLLVRRLLAEVRQSCFVQSRPFGKQPLSFLLQLIASRWVR